MRRLVVVALVALAGCHETEYSAELRESGRVEQVTYLPSESSTGVGMTSGGNLAVVTSSTSAKYVIVFSCLHGKFTLSPTSAQSKELFKRLSQGDSVTIRYREVYHIKDGNKYLADLDFIDAMKK